MLPDGEPMYLVADNFARGLKPKYIIGARPDEKGNAEFLMEWENGEADIVTSKVASEKCPHIVIEFYEERFIFHNTDQEEDEHIYVPPDEMNGFARGLKPKQIIGACPDEKGNVMFLIKWITGETEFVRLKIANEKCPRLVIQFYEERLNWLDP